jgi:SAM-dependent methyltransferase
VPLASVDQLDELRVARAASLPLNGLAPHNYARDHSAFEALSNQRCLIADWFVDRLSSSHTAPLSVLAVGCGDGALDATVAERLLARDPDAGVVRYVGVEPLGVSAKHFHNRMGRIDNSRLSFDTVVAPFANSSLDETFDVVTFVHSMYYVPDVAEAVQAASALLRPDGEAIVLSAPRGGLNLLADLLAPAIEGHRQWFSDDVHDALTYSDLDLSAQATIEAVVDLTGASDEVLDFTVQAELTPDLRGLVRSYLADISVVAGRCVVRHPVDVYVVRTASAH